MSDIITIILYIVSVATGAVGFLLIFRPARAVKKPVKGPVDVARIQNADVETGDVSSDVRTSSVPLDKMECELEISHPHPGDIFIGSAEGHSPSTVISPEKTHDTPQGSPVGTGTNGQETETDVVRKSIEEENREPLDRPLELFDE